MDMVDQLTCGQGLAENAILPARLGDLIASIADVLDVHTEALDLEDERSQREHDVYLKLAAEQREVATRLRAIGDEMAGYRDLPMAKHDPDVMTSPKAVGAFEEFVAVEEQLLTMLDDRVRKDKAMLDEMRRASE
jgi:hypothetical protein